MMQGYSRRVSIRYTKRDILEILRTIECQHQQYARATFCHPAEYLRQAWGAWAKILRKKYPENLVPTPPWSVANQ